MTIAKASPAEAFGYVAEILSAAGMSYGAGSIDGAIAAALGVDVARTREKIAIAHAADWKARDAARKLKERKTKRANPCTGGAARKAQKKARAAKKPNDAKRNEDGEKLSRPRKKTAPDSAAEQKCRVCGCTDSDCRQCIEKTGERCYWVEPDLCSACAPRDAVLGQLTKAHAPRARKAAGR